ncbi:MAG: TadG family pilus assembly protein [Kiloniellaceae bacterium]
MLDYSRRPFLRDERGSVGILFAVSLTMIAGFAALVVDSSYFYVMQNRLQVAADAAAIAAIGLLPNQDAARTAALDYAAKNLPGADNGNVMTAGDVVFGNWDDATRSFTPGGVPVNAVQTTARRTQAGGNAVPTFFGVVLGYQQVDIATSAVALQFSLDEFCMVALDPSASGAISLTGDSKIEVEECGIAANSSSPSSFSVLDDSELEAESLSTVGGIVQGGGAEIETTNPPETNSSPVVDPLAYLDVPAFSGCGGGTNLTITSNTTLSPGVYCDGLRVTNGAKATLNPGVYIIDRGDLVLDGGSKIEGTEVVIFLTSSGAAADIGSLSITDHSRLETTAPTSGPYKDLSIIQDRNAPSSGQNIVSGVSSGGGPEPALETTGFIYLPAQELYVAQEAKVESESEPGCAKLVARLITVLDDAKIEIECDDSVLTTSLGRSRSKLRL